MLDIIIRFQSDKTARDDDTGKPADAQPDQYPRYSQMREVDCLVTGPNKFMWSNCVTKICSAPVILSKQREIMDPISLPNWQLIRTFNARRYK